MGIGMLLGAFYLYFVIQSVKNMLYGVSAFDPTTLVAAGALLTLVALIAGLIRLERRGWVASKWETAKPLHRKSVLRRKPR